MTTHHSILTCYSNFGGKQKRDLKVMNFIKARSPSKRESKFMLDKENVLSSEINEKMS